MKKIINISLVLLLTSCAELQQFANDSLQKSQVTNLEISTGLKQALELGVTEQVSMLTQPDGFFQNEMVRILLPDDLQRVDSGLRSIGLGNLVDEGLRVLNKAAEEAVSEATPIFVEAIKQMTFQDARGILMGDQNAATAYLKRTTQEALYQKFEPVIQSNFNKVGANEIWTNIIDRYNRIPLVTRVNPNLTQYVTEEALNGVYTMIEVEEKEIRSSVNARSTDLLRRVFVLQD